MDEAYPRARSLPDLLQTEFGRRAVGIGVALVLELLLLLALLSLSQSFTPPEAPTLTEVDLAAHEYAEAPPEQPEPEQPRQDNQPTPQLTETVVAPQQPVLPPAVVIPLPEAPRVPVPEASPTPPRPGVRMGPPQGPPNTGAPTTSGDSQRVGTAPNGEPLYAARWYREPGDEVRGYFADSSPGSGLIACRTIPNFYVTDCVAIGETQGSNIIRAMLAASGSFRVRPAQIGGRSLVGSWVRIRFDYIVRRQ